MKANEIIDVIDSFKNNEYEKILIDGNWGIGKTKYVTDCIEQDKLNSCYISLFGKRKIESVTQEIYFNIIDQYPNGLLKKYYRLFTEKTKALNVSYLGMNMSLPLVANIFKSLKKELKSKEKYIIVLDDFERIHDELDIKEVFGLIDSLSKVTGVKIIVIASTHKFSTNHKKMFDEYKEKSIDRTYTIKDYSDDAPSKILGNEIWQVIEPLVLSQNYKNLRTFQKLKLYINEVIELLNKKMFTEKFSKNDVYKMCFATVFFNIEYSEKVHSIDSDNHIKDDMDYISKKIVPNYLDKNINKKIFEMLHIWYKIGDFSKEEFENYIKAINEYEEKIVNFYSSENDVEKMITSTEMFLKNLNGNERLDYIINRVKIAQEFCDILSINFNIDNKEILSLLSQNVKTHINLEKTCFENQEFIVSYNSSDLIKELRKKIQEEYFVLLLERILKNYENESYNEIFYLRQLKESIISINDKSIQSFIIDNLKTNEFIFPSPIDEISQKQWLWCVTMKTIVSDINENWEVGNLNNIFEKNIKEKSSSKLYQYRIERILESNF
ncbi:P-loop NTPase fold protein [Mammaliicoccus sciuri]|uniref:P-loop NTPase fold protein n=1 Tax=Mammaliicoccus sciuri TaxID=1296 RepID=UPI001FB1D9D9|nr:P-loop NTPase fold protein [Mammaliicoccus sciuri]MCJ0941388.1 P-loop NTPase fold protein [Mammaliicoccus sciuri]